MASATSKTELDEITQLEQRIVAIRAEIQILTAEGLTTGAVLPVLKRRRKEKLQAELRNLLQKLRSLKQNPSQPKHPVSLPVTPKIDGKLLFLGNSNTIIVKKTLWRLK